MRVVNVNKDRLLGLEIRLHKLKTNGRNIDSPGVIGKIEREIRRIKEAQGEVHTSPFLLGGYMGFKSDEIRWKWNDTHTTTTADDTTRGIGPTYTTTYTTGDPVEI